MTLVKGVTWEECTIYVDLDSALVLSLINGLNYRTASDIVALQLSLAW